MSQLQPYFQAFHDAIRLNQFDENEQLREKRDMLLAELRERLPKDLPAFRSFNQGSYAYNTGTMPKDGNYDIDVGVVFQCTRDRFPNPVDLKKHVRDALTHTRRTVRIRNPCVTVEYMRGGEVDYHVDLAVYVERAGGDALDLAVGREGADANHRSWQHDDPEGLVAAIKKCHATDPGAAKQMRHCVRYLKRWRDHRFPDGNGPISCALTIAAFYWFESQIDFFSKTPNDVVALLGLTQRMLDNFQTKMGTDGTLAQRLKVTTPVSPNDDLLRGLTDAQMATFEAKLKQLRDALQASIDDADVRSACQRLRTQFGDEFPVPPAGTAKKVQAPYVHTGQSA